MIIASSETDYYQFHFRHLYERRGATLFQPLPFLLLQIQFFCLFLVMFHWQKEFWYVWWWMMPRRTLILWNFTKTYTQNKSNTFDLVIASFLNADIGITKNCCAKSRIGLKLMALRLWKEKNQREGVSSTCKNDSDLDWGEVQFQFLLG